ncbi:AraC family transcriptional regulator [Gordonia liuliyuniae]|uniref:AraC family transcriptional regulator n=1 Tax=Gordonia liuliyuniae TaxID=2911517 RepID=A0ABS9IRA2_9ACTN|nr:AraC family transcriptional regulator [Gordonia liuliyuniae]MCF8588077.1 AraC family transcriptional regulator [Gordonia liuliyuniae]
MKPLARYASLANFVELARSLDLEPVRLLRSVGLDPGGVALQDRWIPASAVADLLERTAAQARCDDLGTRLAELRRLSHLGPLSLVLREEPDIRSALTLLIRHERMYNEALHTSLRVADGVATVRVDLDLGRPGADRQSIDLAVGVLYTLMRELSPPTWRPLAVSFVHSPPVNSGTSLRLFGGLARYDRAFNGITMYEADLDRRIRESDPQLLHYTRRMLSGEGADTRPAVAVRTRQLIEMLLPTGRCSVEQVARSLGVDRRTVHRRLAAEGTTFTAVVDDTRAGLAGHLVASRLYSFAEIAATLGFSSPSNFSRWFRGRYGCTPRQWRTAGGPHAPAARLTSDL